MTVTSTHASDSSTALEYRSSAGGPVPHPPRRPRGRLGTVAVMIVSLLCAGWLKQAAMTRQAAAVAGPAGAPQARSTLGNMNSFALALLLGGLRGPLVMFLWSTSESQKADKDLEDFDTKVEWIRLLQPEFDTVHIFQIWNKAYNISVLMASPASKYAVVLEALEYARSVDEERPGNINILHSVSNVYSGKLGATNLPECPFYMRQFREESMDPELRKQAYADDEKGFRKIGKKGPLLGADNRLLPALVTPVRTRPAGLAAASEWNDGSSLQYLKPYGEFPYGVSVLAMSYNYAKRAEVAMNVEGQKPLQISPMVIDSRPALELKAWGEEEARRARAFEARAFGIAAPVWSEQVDMALAQIPVNAKVVDAAALKGAVATYDLAIRLAKDARREYLRHLANPEYAGRYATYRSHLDDVTGMELVCTADRDYLAAMSVTDPAGRAKLLRGAQDSGGVAAEYARAMTRFERTVLEYYTDDSVLAVASPPGFNNTITIQKLRLANVDEVYLRARAATMQLEHDTYSDEHAEYDRSIGRCKYRIDLIQAELNPGPATQPQGGK
ncbi:MAG: hypothetical protein JWM97_786 [Phycisphaerales bacterium]|nr:hypothetical protein [Phycisphaerales bacterium]